MSEDLLKFVFVQGKGSARWDSKEYDLSQPVKVRLGVARHWESIGIALTITDAPEANISPKDIVNPLESENQGEAFAGLRRGRRPKEG